MSQFFRDSISFHRLHSKTCLAVISVFNSLNLCLGVQVSVPHDFLTFARLKGPIILLSLIFLYALLHDFLLLNLLNVVQHHSELLQFFGGDSDASSPKNDTETGRELKPVNDVDKY